MPRTAKGSPTMLAVAEHAGVNKSTVSRILNDSYPKGFSVRPEVRERVLRAAKELSFKPNPFVRGLKAKRTKMVAMLGLRDFGWSSRGADEHAINAMIDALADADYEVCTTFIKPGNPDFQPPRWRVDAAVVVGNSSAEQVSELDQSGIPYVTVNGPAGPAGGSVIVDDAHGAESAVRKLIELGHTRIAYLYSAFDATPPAAGRVAHASEIDRRDAYVAAMQEAGLEPVAGYDRTDWTAEQAIEQIVVRDKATAVLSYHHVMAVQHVAAIQRTGRRVPDDVSVLCFNDAFPTAEMHPSLTAMSLPGEAMGREAARMILDMIEGGTPKQMLFSESLILRESTARCR
ncbi:MAG: LacI family DNA-binding transcriptional regulator [Planctomycetota bacterium]